MSQPSYRHLFGPVPSRRFGRSLGIDLIPFKTCSFDCIFCQLGKTTRKTTTRDTYVPIDEVIAELSAWIDTNGAADYITLAGSGEPTLHAEFGRIIDFVHTRTTIPVALLTNGSLLDDPDVRAQAALADVVKVSLSAWNQASLEQVNRPAAGIDFQRMVAGQERLRQDLKGQLWLEVFLSWGINADPVQVSRIAALAARLHPDRIQLNTAVRPPCEAYAEAVPQDTMAELAACFTPVAEVIAEYSSDRSAAVRANETDILQMLRRRPCTLEQICAVFAIHRNEASKYLGKLLRTGQITREAEGETAYYSGSHGKTA